MFRKGEITTRKNIKFKDNEKLDINLNGHPTVNLIDDDGSGNAYFLTMTSQTANYIKNKDKCILMNTNKYNKLKRPSLVKVEHIYTREEEFRCTPTGILTSEEYNNVIDKLKDFKENNNCHKDNSGCRRYAEIKDKL